MRYEPKDGGKKIHVAKTRVLTMLSLDDRFNSHVSAPFVEVLDIIY